MEFAYTFESNPEAFGFKQLDQLSSGGGYEWAEAKVWKRLHDGALFFYMDSGCSCSSFMDGLDSPSGLTALTPATIGELFNWVDSMDYWFPADQRQDFKRRIDKIMLGV